MGFDNDTDLFGVFVPVDLVIDKKIETYYENKRESYVFSI